MSGEVEFRLQQALLGIAEAAEGLIRLIDANAYTLRYDMQRAEWGHIASIARYALRDDETTQPHAPEGEPMPESEEVGAK